ncbi:MAG: hypothetical protein A2X77_04350 [Gammaproteobacteria bacterium GWE2_42_36]|nr:MAG: hypothetical protein A2X77_04350 [Gammaproteobacteria bacterium GWE2_42_36]
MARAETYHKPDKRLLKKVGAQIRMFRENLGLTIEQLSNRAGINPNYLQRCETGKANPSISVMASILKALNLSFGEFFKTNF